MKQEYIANSPSQTKKLGGKIAREILNPVRDSGDSKEPKSQRISNRVKKRTRKTTFVIGLEGELGGGKTTFLQGFARGLGIKEKVLSPTFVIMKKFKIENCKLKIENFYHIDCYRVQKPKELLDLGFKQIISNPQNIVAIEWADKIKKIIPKNSVWIHFKFIDERKRRITISF